MPVRVGIVGVGKIARDRHVPALRDDPSFSLIACASRNARIEGIANYRSVEAMLDGSPELDAVAICTPPRLHHEQARVALMGGKHVLLEKPPCASLAQLDDLVRLAAVKNLTLFQSWHSRFAPAVDSAAAWLRTRHIRRASIVWKENVREWHPGQSWLWQADGFGVFDPGINALSILTKILSETISVRTANLFIPSNREAPIAADLELATGVGAPVGAAFDFRHTDVPAWDIDIETNGGTLKLSIGGSCLAIDGQVIVVPPRDEYAALYRHFDGLIARGVSDVDAKPFQLVLEAQVIAKRFTVEPFED